MRDSGDAILCKIIKYLYTRKYFKNGAIYNNTYGQKLWGKIATLTLIVFARLILTILKYTGTLVRKNTINILFLFFHGDYLQKFTQLSKFVIHRMSDNNRIAVEQREISKNES